MAGRVARRSFPSLTRVPALFHSLLTHSFPPSSRASRARFHEISNTWNEILLFRKGNRSRVVNERRRERCVVGLEPADGRGNGNRDRRATRRGIRRDGRGRGKSVRVETADITRRSRRRGRMIDARRLHRSCVVRMRAMLCVRTWRAIIIQIFTIARARRAFSRRRRLPAEIASSEYLLNAPIC